MRRIEYTLRAIRALLLAVTLGTAAGSAAACGYCVEDKIASVYDHAVITRATTRRHQVAFFALEGKLAGTAVEAKTLAGIAATAWGTDPGSVRINVETATLSVAFDPAQANFGALHRFLQRKFTPRGLALMPLQVLDAPSKPKTTASN
jgi:hypothetical protein